MAGYERIYADQDGVSYFAFYLPFSDTLVILFEELVLQVTEDGAMVEFQNGEKRCRCFQWPFSHLS